MDPAAVASNRQLTCPKADHWDVVEPVHFQHGSCSQLFKLRFPGKTDSKVQESVSLQNTCPISTANRSAAHRL